MYGAKENKKLQLFVDDLNLPNPDEYGVQRCNEVCHFDILTLKLLNFFTVLSFQAGIALIQLSLSVSIY